MGVGSPVISVIGGGEEGRWERVRLYPFRPSAGNPAQPAGIEVSKCRLTPSRSREFSLSYVLIGNYISEPWFTLDAQLIIEKS